MPERNKPDPIQYPGFDYDLSRLSPEQIAEQLAVMGQGGALTQGRKATPAEQKGRTVDPGLQSQAVSSPVVQPSQLPSSEPEMLPMPGKQFQQTGPGMNVNPSDYRWELMNPPGVQQSPYLANNPQVVGPGLQSSAVGGPSVDDLARQIFDVGPGTGMTGGMWASPEQRAFAARQQLEQMKLATGLQGEQARLEAARTDAQTQREFQSGEAALGRKNQLEVAELQNSSRNDNLKLFKQRAWQQAEEEAKGNIPLMSKLFEQKVNAYMATQGDQPQGGGQPGATAGPTAPTPDAQKIASTLALMSKSGTFGGLNNFNAFLEDAAAKGYDPNSLSTLAQSLGSQTTPGGYDLQKELAKVLGYNIIASEEAGPGSSDGFYGARGTDPYGSGVAVHGEGMRRLDLLPYNRIEIPGQGTIPLESAYRPTILDQGLRTAENKQKAAQRAKIASQLLQQMMKAQQPQGR